MSTTMVDLEGTDLTMVVTVVPRRDAAGLAREVDKLVSSVGSNPTLPGWRVLPRSEALVKYPNAWEDAPAWDGGADDQERMAWIRERLSGPVTTGFTHLATMPIDERPTGTELSEVAGFTNAGGWKSALSHAAVLSRRVGRKPVWGAERIGGVWRYSMSAEVRTLWTTG